MKLSNRLLILSGPMLCLPVLVPRMAVPQAPTFQEVTRHAFGERITEHHEMVRYLERLDEESPRVVVRDQGKSWESRRLLVAIVTSPENHARLDEIQQSAQRLGDPRSTAPEQAAQLIPTQPVIVWLGGSIHGFELSGSEGLLKLLEHLTTRDDPATMHVLRNAVVLVDPMLNPDGRDAFAHLNHENIGAVPNPERDDWSNDFTGWQARKFRTGHYYFDTNRDWFAHTQRETQARVPTLVAWRPQVVVDAHEMGADVEFYFDPATDPYPQFFPEFASRWFEVFNGAYAEAFDSAGYEFMTRERYNYFYPGYTTSFGSYQGAVGMLFEQGSTRGLVLTRADRSVRRLADALEQQYLAAWTAARTAAARREEMLREYYDAHRAAVEDGRQGTRRYLIAPEGDPNMRVQLANMLARSGVEVQILTESARLNGVRDRAGRTLGQQSFPVGTYIVEAAQPRNRLIRTLLEPEVQLPESFLELARSRFDRGENPRFYDITAWSLPLLFNLRAFGATDGRALNTRQMAPGERSIEYPSSRPGYAYLIDGGQAAAVAALFHLKTRGFRAAMTLKPTRIEGRDFSSGTAIVRVGQNPETVHDELREIAQRLSVDVVGVKTGLSAPGFPALGSGEAVIPIREPEIAIVAEAPVQGYSFGWAWYTLDRQYQIPVTVLRSGSLSRTRLDRFNVLILPSVSSSALDSLLEEAGQEPIKRWVRDGGTLVSIGAATEFVRDQLELIALRSWYETEDGKDAQHFNVPGALVRGSLNRNTWLSAGYDSDELPLLVSSDRVYLAPEGPPSSSRRTVVRYHETSPLKLSGHLWPESLERLPGAVFAYEERVGRGRVIVFAEDVNFRGYWRGANRLFLNAVVVGPSAP